MLVCEMLYAGYLMLRLAIDDPTQRARILRLCCRIFAFVDVPIVFFSIKWWRTQHPQPCRVGRRQHGSRPTWNTLFLNWIPVILLGVVMVAIRMRQENIHREVEALRRYAHWF